MPQPATPQKLSYPIGNEEHNKELQSSIKRRRIENEDKELFNLKNEQKMEVNRMDHIFLNHHERSGISTTNDIIETNGYDIAKVTIQGDGMYWYLHTYGEGAEFPPLLVVHAEGGFKHDVNDEDIKSMMNKYGDNIKKLEIINLPLVTKQHHWYLRQCINFAGLALKVTMNKHRKENIKQGHSQTYFCHIFTNHGIWNGMVNNPEASMLMLSILYCTEIVECGQLPHEEGMTFFKECIGNLMR